MEHLLPEEFKDDINDILSGVSLDDNIYSKIDEYRNNLKPTVNITPLSVSVQSAKAKMSCSFELKDIAENISNYIDNNDGKKYFRCFL